MMLVYVSFPRHDGFIFRGVILGAYSPIATHSGGQHANSRRPFFCVRHTFHHRDRHKPVHTHVRGIGILQSWDRYYREDI